MASEEELLNLLRLNRNNIPSLIKWGILKTEDSICRESNIGESDYSKHIIQPWAIWQDWHLNPWDADIVKRVLRTKATDTRKMDYKKIIHICQERIRQIENGYTF